MTTQPNPEKPLRDLLEQARSYQRTAEYDQAISLLNEIKTRAQVLGDIRALTEARILTGFLQYQQGNYAGAATSALETFDDPTAQPLIPLEAMRLHQLVAMTFRQLGDLPTGIDHYLQMLELARSVGDRNQESRALHGIASIHDLMHDLPAALDHCYQALEIYQRLGDRYGQAVVLTNISSLYTSLENGAEAVKTALQARALYQQIGVGENPVAEAGTMLSLARAHFANGDHDAALRVLGETDTMTRRYSIETTRTEVLLLRADIDGARGDFNAAIMHYREGLALADSHGRSTIFYECYRKLSEAYQAIGNLQEALTAYQRFHQLKEILFNADSDNRLKGLEIRYRTEAAQREAIFYREQAAHIAMLRSQEAETFARINTLREEMLAAIRHDLKSPLTSIRMSVYLLKKPAPTETRDRWLENIDRQVTRMEKFMSDVMELVRLESRVSLEKRAYSATELAQIAVNALMERAVTKDINITIIPTEQDTRILIDPDRMIRALTNIIDNAIVYSPAGASIRISVNRVPSTKGDQIRFEIRDTGYGISDDDLPQVFEPFFRGQREEHAGVEGTGLGLSMVKTIVDQHAGTVTIESSVNRGTVVIILLSAL